MKSALVAGSTGLIGRSLLGKLLADPSYDRVVSIGRKPSGLQHAKLEDAIVDFDRLQDFQSKFVVDDVFCCLGTTMKRAGSREAFWKVDHDYPLHLARLSHENGAQRFFLVSALGADPRSSFYYNEVKGKLEEAVTAIPFNAIHIFRPSLLLGPRDENRPGEEAAKTFYRVFNFLIPTKYKAIAGDAVAEAMIRFARRNDQGKFIHSSGEMQQLQK